jgi:plastocyanin
VTVAVAVVTVASMLFIGAAGASAAKVKVKNYKFSPGTVKIDKGDTVVWKFVQGKHNVKGSGFKSRAKRSGKYRHKFKQKGTFRYRCTLHQGMNGKVKVK